MAEDPVVPEEEPLVAVAAHVRGDLLFCEGDAADVREGVAVVEVEFPFAQPAADRHAEALFRALDELTRQQRRERSFQNPFRLAVAQLERPRDAPREIDELDVEERRTRFERAHHRSAIDLREDVVLQIDGGPELQRAVDEVRLRAAFPRLDRFAVDFLLVDRLAEQPGEIARLERAHPDGIPQLRAIAQAHERAFHFEVEADVGVAHRQARGDEPDRLMHRLRHELRVLRGFLQGAERIVAGEELVAAVAAERDGDVPAREARKQVRRQE